MRANRTIRNCRWANIQSPFTRSWLTWRSMKSTAWLRCPRGWRLRETALIPISWIVLALIGFGCSGSENTTGRASGKPGSAPIPIAGVGDDLRTLKKNAPPTHLSETDIGAPFYTNSKEISGARTSGANGEQVTTSIRSTPDSPEQVAKFYQSKYPTMLVRPLQRIGDTAFTALRQEGSDGSGVMITISKRGGQETEIMITRHTK